MGRAIIESRIIKIISKTFNKLREPKVFLIVSLVMLLVAGTLYICHTWFSSISRTSEQALITAATAEAGFLKEEILKLEGVPEDIVKVEYVNIKSALAKIVNINTGIRFSYIYILKNGKLYFLADSEPHESIDCSPPGQLYNEASKEYYKPFEDGNALITKPSTDRWGTWVSILVPMKNPENGRVVAVFAMDYPAEIWDDNASQRTTQSGLVVFVIFLLILAFYKLLNINKILNEEKNKLDIANEKNLYDIQKISKSEEKFSKTFHSRAALTAITAAEDGRIIDINDAFLKMMTAKREEVLGRTTIELNIFNNPGQREELKRIMLEKGRVSDFELQLIDREGSLHSGILTIDPIIIGDESCWIISMADITERKQVEDALKRSEERHSLLIKNSHDIIYTIDTNGIITFASPSWTSLLGHPVNMVEGEAFQQFIYQDDSVKFDKFISRIMKTKQSLTGIEYRIRHMNGSWRWHTTNAVPLLDETGTVISIEGIARDITERKHTEKEILYLSYHDKLTGLYNLRFYEEELKRLDTKRNLPISLVMADVNGLKLANDAFGHLTGDRVLVKISAAIKKESRTDDILARISGDEFVLLLPKTGIEDTEKIIKRIKERISHSKLGNFVLSASFGHAIKTKISEDMSAIFKKAEDNMYISKLQENTKIRNKILNVIVKTLYEKSEYEQEHAQMVAMYCENLARQFGMTKEEIEMLKTAGSIHDIGKITIDEKILNKPGQLSEAEWVIIRKHPDAGFRILVSISEFSKIAKIVLSHHERWDGNGYPKGIKGETIPLGARILAVADAYAAMTGPKSYRETVSKDEAVREIRINAGTQFDPEVSMVFIETVLKESFIRN